MSDQPDLADLLGQPNRGPDWTPPPAVQITRDPMTGRQDVSLTIVADRTPGLEEWSAEARRLGLTVPDGFKAEMVEARHDPAAWHRDAEGQDAVTRAVWRCRYRLVPDILTIAAEAMADVPDVLTPKAEMSHSALTDDYLVSVVGDTQWGKIDGDGTAGTIRRAMAEYRRHAARAREIQPASVTLVDVGDCIEGTVSGQGATRGRSDIPLTDQIVVAVRLLRQRIALMRAAYSGPIRVVVVPGNHDELSRVGGRVDTLYTDSWALTVAKIVASVEQPGVTWYTPERDHTTVTLDVGGVVHAVAHGHQWGKADGWRQWWERQSHGRQNPGHATVLLAGHYHHLRVEDSGGGRLFVQVPSLDGGSRWFTDRYGASSPARALSYVIRHGAIRDLDPILPAA